jgi:hypothetical protein
MKGPLPSTTHWNLGNSEGGTKVSIMTCSLGMRQQRWTPRKRGSPTSHRRRSLKDDYIRYGHFIPQSSEVYFLVEAGSYPSKMHPEVVPQEVLDEFDIKGKYISTEMLEITIR